MRQRIIWAFLLLCSLNGFAKEYHVDTSNGSQGDGSLENPFKTIAQASEVMVPGDICYIHAGTYRENIVPRSSGNE